MIDYKPYKIKGDDNDVHLDHQVEEVEPLELPPAGHLRIGRVPEDKVPNPLSAHLTCSLMIELIPGNICQGRLASGGHACQNQRYAGPPRSVRPAGQD